MVCVDKHASHSVWLNAYRPFSKLKCRRALRYPISLRGPLHPHMCLQSAKCNKLR